MIIVCAQAIEWIKWLVREEAYFESGNIFVNFKNSVTTKKVKILVV